MASNSLLDLVCQLQNFETKISEIVMEMSTKLCALNDTKLFVLLSTSMGRKVVGAPELCNQFFRQQLHADGTEVYLEFDHVQNSMVEVPILPFDRNMPVFPGSPFVGGGGGGGSGSRKRASTDDDSESRSKSPRLDSSLGDGGGVGAGGGIESQFEAWDNDDAECLVIEEKPETAIAISSTFSRASPNGRQSNGFSGGITMTPWQSRTPVIPRTIAPSSSRSTSKGGNPDYEIPDGTKVRLTDFFAENQYVHAFVDCDAMNVTDRDSKEHKVLASLIMQFAKHCGPFCPNDKPDRIAFINHTFDIMWQHLPNLHSYENHVINNGHQNYSMRGYCKTRFSGRMNSISARAKR